jgi:hypothetical protein
MKRRPTLTKLAALLLAMTTLPAFAGYQFKVASKGLKSEIPAASFALQGTAPAGHPFGLVMLGEAAATEFALTFRNVGGQAGSLVVPSASGANAADFPVSSNCTNVAKNTNCEVTVSFVPQTTGSRAATLSVAGATYNFTGTGATAANFVVEGAGLTSFGSSLVGTPAVSQTLTLRNTGTVAGTLAAPQVTGTHAADFSANSYCANVAGGATCTVTVGFTPTAGGTRSASLSVAGASYTLSGAGSAPANFVVVSTSPLNFGSSLVGTPAGSQVIYMRNTGTMTGTLTLPQLGGANPGDFSANTNCVNTAGGADCTITLGFTPTAVGGRSASLTLNGSTYGLAGTGSAPTYATLTPASGAVISNGGYTVQTSPNNQAGAYSNVGKNSGKWYWEVTFDKSPTGQQYLLPGVAISSVAGAPSGFYNNNGGIGAFASDGSVYAGPGNYPGNIGAFGVGATVGIGLDMDNKTVTFINNGGTPRTFALSVTNQAYYAAIGDGTSADIMQATVNFGQSAFKYYDKLPAGYNKGLW